VCCTKSPFPPPHTHNLHTPSVDEKGLPWLSYTAAATLVPELGNFFQTQGVATPANLSDPFLREWRKSTANPVLLQTPPGGTNFQVLLLLMLLMMMGVMGQVGVVVLCSAL